MTDKVHRFDPSYSAPDRCAICSSPADHELHDPATRVRRGLKLATEAHSAAAAVKRELRLGTISFRDAIRDPRAAPIEVRVLIKQLPGWDMTRARMLLIDMMIWEARKVRELRPDMIDPLIETVERRSGIRRSSIGRSAA